MADNGNGSGRSEGHLSVSTEENVTGNKKKDLTEFSSDDYPSNVSSSSLTELPRYELLREKLFNTLKDIGSSEACSGQLKMGNEISDLKPADWDGHVADQLSELLENNLFAAFRSAVRKIVECGYNEEDAECAVLTRGFYIGVQDVESNVVNNALFFLSSKNEADTLTKKKNEADTPTHNGFEDFQSLVECTLLDMICVLGEVKPSLTVAEAMWCLLISDLNLSQACAVERDPLRGFCGKEVSGKSSYTELPESKFEAAQISLSSTNKPQNSIPFTTYLQNSESKNRAAGAVPQLPNLKNPCAGEVTNTKKDNVVPGLEAGFDVSGKHVEIMSQTNVEEENSALHVTDTKFVESLPGETQPTPKAQLSNAGSFKGHDYNDVIPYDNCLGKYVPQDEKDEIILMLVSKIQARKKEVQGWIDWANKKVMQVTGRLSKDQAELKTLRREKLEIENFEKAKQILKENNTKRLSEIEQLLCNESIQIEMANSKLELEQSVLKKEMEAATQKAVQSDENLREGVLREKEALKKVQSLEMNKALLQEEFTTEKHNLAELQQEVEKSERLLNQIEALWRQEEKEKLKILKEASSLRRKREKLEALEKAKEDRIKQNAENEMEKYKQDIKKLEHEISEMRLESESLKIVALRSSIDMGYGISLTENKSAPAVQGNLIPKVPHRLPVFRDICSAGSVKPERDCVMCLTEEMSVVFLPCAHQVLCEKCNALHEKQGMNECPSCRTPIQRRIQARFC